MKAARDGVALQRRLVGGDEVVGVGRPRRQLEVGQVVVDGREDRRVDVELRDALVRRPRVHALHATRVLVRHPRAPHVAAEHRLRRGARLVHVVRDVGEEVGDVVRDLALVAQRVVCRVARVARRRERQVELPVALVQAELRGGEVAGRAVARREVGDPRKDGVVVGVAELAAGQPVQHHQVVEVRQFADHPALHQRREILARVSLVVRHRAGPPSARSLVSEQSSIIIRLIETTFNCALLTIDLPKIKI